MKFTFSALAVLSFLTSIALSHPANNLPSASKRQDDLYTQCTGNSYEACVSDTFCITSFPEGCYCLNDAKRRCAIACGVDLDQVEFQDCTVPPTGAASSEVKLRECFDRCVGTKRCITSWPEGCYCLNSVKIGCAVQCGVLENINVFLSGELQDCEVPVEEGTPQP